MQDKQPKPKLPRLKVKPKKSPTKLNVAFPVMEEPTTIKRTELENILKYIKKMSNEEYTFEFTTPSFCKVIPK